MVVVVWKNYSPGVAQVGRCDDADWRRREERQHCLSIMDSSYSGHQSPNSSRARTPALARLVHFPGRGQPQTGRQPNEDGRWRAADAAADATDAVTSQGLDLMHAT